jgi:hypothetical protein
MSAYLYKITSWPLQEDKRHLPEEEHVCGGLAVPRKQLAMLHCLQPLPDEVCSLLDRLMQVCAGSDSGRTAWAPLQACQQMVHIRLAACCRH